MMDETSAQQPYIRPNLQNLPFWNPTQILASERTGKIHRMDLNECPYPPSPKVVEVIRNMADRVNRYPDGGLPRLSERMTADLDIPYSHLCWGMGSSELLANAIRIAVAPGDGVVTPGPIWRRFSGVYRAVAADLTEIPNQSDGGIDVEGLLSGIGNNTRIVVCVSPNNPSGLTLSPQELERLADEIPENVLFYLDEAYHEFAVHAGGPDGLDILKHRKGPWVITRTFSKAYALAGLRLGYAISSEEAIANALRGVTGTFNISHFAEDAAMAALDDPDYRKMLLDNNAIERQRIIDGLAALGIKALPSVTNFVSAPIGRPAAPVVNALRDQGIRIGGWADAGYENFIRVSMGLPEDTDVFLEVFAEIMAEDA